MTRPVQLLMGPLLFLCGIVFLYYGQQEASKARALADHGKTAPAQAISITKTRNQLGIDSYRAELTFVAADGFKMDLFSEVPESSVETLKRGGSVDLRYLPEDPNQVEVVGVTGGADNLRLMGIGLLIVGAIVSWWKIFRKGARTGG
jgi:uncharacterized protein DUF3592